MIIDHVGLIFFPHLLIFRIIGRLSFPLFAWGIANGAIHTKNPWKYLLRLFIFALISQYPFYLFGRIAPDGLAKTNVIFTLFLGLAAIQVFRVKLPLLLKIISLYLIIYFSVFIDSDYQAVGVLSILFSYIFINNLAGLFVSQLFIFISPLIIYLILGGREILPNLLSFTPVFAPFSFFITKLYSGKPGPRLKYLFYIVYPLQYLIIFLMKSYVFI